jgi:undecaprenyl-diphosphatase
MIVLGVIEGITEFLPISSTGHLIVAADLLGLESVEGVYEIVIQSGAVLAVLWLYHREIVERVRALSGPRRETSFWIRLAVAAIPALAVGYLLGDLITETLFTPAVVAGALIVGGIVLWAVDRFVPGRTDSEHTRGLDAMTLPQALAIGIAQIVALIPGASRAAASIVGGLLVGLDRPTATAFSFWLAIPTLGGATAYAFVKNLGTLADQGRLPLLAVGVVTAFIVSLVVMRWLLRYVAGHDFRWFALYRVLVGIVILVAVRP